MKEFIHRRAAESAKKTLEPGRSLDQLTELIIGAAIEVHKQLGPGLLESAYEECLCYELSQLGLAFRRQVESPIPYKGLKLDCGFKMDLLVEDAVVLELKSVEQLIPIHTAQLLTYLKLSNKRVGLLLNFNDRVMTRGLKRIVNQFHDPIDSAHSASRR